MTQRVHRVRVVDVVRETADAHSLVLEPDEPAAFSYRPGQFLTLRVPSDRGPVARCYSLASAPHVDDALKITIKRTAAGYGSNWICDNVVPGAEIDVLPPAGAFVPKSLDGDFLLCAGGSGITPVISILKSALAGGRGRVVLLYANRDESSVIFRDELVALQRAHPDRLVVVHWLESVQGLPSVPALQALLAPWLRYEAFVCGPGPFMDGVQTALLGLGARRSRVHVERFVSLHGDLLAVEDTPAEDADSVDAEVTVLLDGVEKTFHWPKGRKLLDVLLESGMDAPYSCRQGACSACGCRLEEGEVALLANDVLEEEDFAEGWVLSCQALARTPVVRVTYD